MRKNKGFTLVELLAIIVILAIIALIIIPKVIEIIENKRLRVAEDFTYELVKTAEQYQSNFILKNDGSIPEKLVFLCNDGCSLISSDYGDYKIEGLEELFPNEKKTTGGRVVINTKYKTIDIFNLQIDGFVCNYLVDGKVKCVSEEEYKENNKLIEPNIGVSNPSGWAQNKTVTLQYRGDGEYLLRPTVDIKMDVNATECYVDENDKRLYYCDDKTLKAGKILDGGKWYSVGNKSGVNVTLTFEKTGSVVIKVSNELDYIATSSTTVTGIDRTPPTNVTFTQTKITSKSISVKASGVDSDSGIIRYQFSKDDGITWEPTNPQENNEYTFDNLKSGEYKVKVKVINGTYINEGENKLNTLISASQTIKTTELAIPMKGTISPSGWAQSKTLELQYSGEGVYLFKPTVNVTSNINVVTCESSNNEKYECEGETKNAGSELTKDTWYMVDENPTLTFSSNGSVAYKIVDGVNYKDGASATIVEIDRTPPTNITLKQIEKTSKSITVEASVTDTESGILKYQFSKDDGISWEPSEPTTEKIYTFGEIQSGKYKLRVKVFNGTIINNAENEMNRLISEMQEIETILLNVPTNGITKPTGWAQSKTIKVNFNGEGVYLLKPSVDVKIDISAITCADAENSNIDCSGTEVSAGGTLTAGQWYKVDGTAILTFASSGSVAYKISDGVNVTTTGTGNIAEIDTTAPTEVTFTQTGQTTNTVTVQASGKDEESGILKYQFSIDGNPWEPTTPQDSAVYKFVGLKSGNHSVKVRVINRTFENNGQNASNTKESTTAYVAPKSLGNISNVSSSPTGWSQAKTIQVNFSGEGTYLLRPSVDVKTNISAITCANAKNANIDCSGTEVSAGGTLTAGQWYKVGGTAILTFASNGSVAYKISDGVNVTTTGTGNVIEIDTTAPTEATFTSNITENIVKIEASGTEPDGSGIIRYQFSKDDGITWEPTTPQENNEYTFSGLTNGTHNVKVRIYNGTYITDGINELNYKDSDSKPITINVDATPPDKPTLIETLGTKVNYYDTSSITLTATSKDTESGINRYEFYNGDTLLGTKVTSANSASITIASLPTTNMNFKVIVYDNKENHNENSVTASCSNNGTYCVEGYNTTIYSCTSTAYTGTRQYSVQGSSCITTTT